MFRVLIEAIYAKIDTDLPEIKNRALFNDQFNKHDDGLIDSFHKPCIFISFPDAAEYRDMGAQVQTTDNLTVRFYIGVQLLKKEDLKIFDLKQKVYQAFNNWEIDGYSKFTRRSESTDESRTNYYVFIQDYQVVVRDADTYYLNKFTEHTVTDLEIDSDLLIDPATVNGIRTDKAINRL